MASAVIHAVCALVARKDTHGIFRDIILAQLTKDITNAFSNTKYKARLPDMLDTFKDLCDTKPLTTIILSATNYYKRTADKGRIPRDRKSAAQALSSHLCAHIIPYVEKRLKFNLAGRPGELVDGLLMAAATFSLTNNCPDALVKQFFTVYM